MGAEREDRDDERDQAKPADGGPAPSRDEADPEEHKQRQPYVGVVLCPIAAEVDEVRRDEKREQVAHVHVRGVSGEHRENGECDARGFRDVGH